VKLLQYNTIQYNIRLLKLDRMQADNTGSGYALILGYLLVYAESFTEKLLGLLSSLRLDSFLNRCKN